MVYLKKYKWFIIHGRLCKARRHITFPTNYTAPFIPIMGKNDEKIWDSCVRIATRGPPSWLLTEVQSRHWNNVRIL